MGGCSRGERIVVKCSACEWLISASVKVKCDVQEVDYLFVSFYGDA